jgi:hypothetical protein
MNDRESMFTDYFCLSVYTMRIAKYCLQMSKSYCSRSRIKHSIHLAELTMDSKITDITLRLKENSRADIMQDLASDDLQAIGNILSRIIQLPSIASAEDVLCDFIRELKRIQNEKMESEIHTGHDEPRQDQGLQDFAA